MVNGLFKEISEQEMMSVNGGCGSNGNYHNLGINFKSTGATEPKPCNEKIIQAGEQMIRDGDKYIQAGSAMTAVSSATGYTTAAALGNITQGVGYAWKGLGIVVRSFGK